MSAAKSKSRRRYFAAAGAARRNTSSSFGYVVNTYTDSDYDYFEFDYSKTIAGTAIDKLVEFTIGTGIRPVFELKDVKGKTDEQIRTELEAFYELRDQLTEIDNKPNVNFKQTIHDATVMALVFGRVLISFEPKESEIPETLYIVHPRDLGKVEINPDYTLKTVTINLANMQKASYESEEMIYLVNKPNSPVRKQMWYGYSEMDRVNGAARALHRIVEYDAPEIAHSMWASYGLFIVNTEGKTDSAAKAQLQTILDGLKPGAFNAVNGKPGEDVEYLPVDLQAKVADLVQLIDSYERIIIGNFGVPGPLLGREEESNMATLIGKIRLFLQGPVTMRREWLSDVISKQWYERNIKRLQPEALEKIRVKTEFEPIEVESWIDKIDGV